MSAATATVLQQERVYFDRQNVEDSTKFGIYNIDRLEFVANYQYSKFRRLVVQWRTETYVLSSVMAKTDHPAFKEILDMGGVAIPWIIEELREHRDFLFVALHIILKEDPTPRYAKGEPHKLIEEWLMWAEREGYTF